MSKEAMKLALEALEMYLNMDTMDESYLLEIDFAPKAITALRKALAEQPAQQEPFCYHDGCNIVGKEFADHSDVFPLYTRPQAREWVELDHDDVHALVNEFFYQGMQPSGVHFANFAKTIEAKLKKKNA